MLEQSSPALVAPPQHGGLADSLYTSAAEHPQALLYQRRTGSGWEPVTAAQFADQVSQVARGLLGSGIAAGDRVGLMSRNRYEWAVLDYAIWSVGAVSVPLYPTASAEQIGWILRDSGAVGCVTETAEHTARLDSVADPLPELTRRWELDSDAIGQIVAAGAEVTDAMVDLRRAAVTPQDPATIVYTSGTTGRPKGCVLTHANFAAEADNAIELLYPVFRAVVRHPASTVLFLPLAHVFGRLVQVACLRAEVCVAHAPSVRPDDLQPDLAALRPTFLLAVPYVFEKVFHTARATAARMGRVSSFDRAVRIAGRYAEALERAAHGGAGPGLRLRAAHALYDLLVYRRIRAGLGGRVRYAISGGAMLGRRLALFFAGAGIIIYEGYGLTETTAAATVNPPLQPRFGTVGLPLPGTSVRIGDDGEVLVRGPHVFARYWNQEPGADEWLPTGDVGQLDDDGYLTITGRSKDLIVTNGGKNVAPGPLEDAVRAEPLVSQCLVVGDNRPYVAALVTVDAEELARRREADPDFSDESLRSIVQQAVDRANAQVSRAESIRRFRLLDGDFTEDNGMLTPSLKMRRQQIVEAFRTDIDQLYTPVPTSVPR